MKVLFVCNGKHNDLNNWSGTVNSIARVLDSISEDVVYIDELKVNNCINLIYKIINKLSNKKFLLTRDLIVSKSYAKQIKKRSKGFDYDVVFSTSSLPIAFLKCDKPIYFYTDATFENMIDYYESFTNISKISKNIGNFIEKLALDNSTNAIYSSKWAKKSAVEYYKIDQNKVKVVNFGLNIENSLTQNQINEVIKNKINDKEIKILFVGVDFKRKGGDLALKIVKRINDKGYNAKLYICGCDINIDEKYSKYTEVLGYLNKNKVEDSQKINELYINSHFFLLPTRNEAYGIVFAEASSYGLPSITTNTGGVSSAIIDGKNGYCLDIDKKEEDYANIIIDIFKDKQRYELLCINSYKEYTSRLNWNVVADKLKHIISEGNKDNEE